MNPDEADGDNAGFTVVTVSEDAAPFGRGPDDDDHGDGRPDDAGPSEDRGNDEDAD